MISIESIFWGQIVIGVLVIVSLRKMIQMKKNIDEVIKEVKEYVTFIIEEEEDKNEQNTQITYKQNNDVKNLKQNHTSKKEAKDEVQTRLIQTVLGEYFP